MRIWITSKNGFISKNLQEYFVDHEVKATSSRQVDIRSYEQVKEFVKNNDSFDMIINASSFGSARLSEDDISLYKETLSSFVNLYRLKEKDSILYNIGSGAEYDRTKSIDGPDEKDFESTHPPTDVYGRAKWMISNYIEKSENCYNLRVFGCFGKYEKETRFIQTCLTKDFVEIHNDVLFGFVYVKDLCEVILKIFEERPDFKTVNMCYKDVYSLSGTKQIIDDILKKENKVAIINNTGKNYYGKSLRLTNFINSTFSETLERYLLHER